MSKYVEYVYALDAKGKILEESEQDGDCTGCFQNNNLDSLLTHEDIHSLKVDFDETVPTAWIKHPLIQALCPGLYRDKDNKWSVIIPSYLETPFDQVICALRLLRHYDNFGEFAECCHGINSDGDVNIVGWSQRHLDNKPFKEKPSIHSIWNNLYCKNLPTASPKEIEKAMKELSEGSINPGVLPPGNIIGGYEKAWNVFPRSYLSDEFPDWDRDDYGKWQDCYEEYLKNRGNVNWTVDHPLCITPMGDCR